MLAIIACVQELYLKLVLSSFDAQLVYHRCETDRGHRAGRPHVQRPGRPQDAITTNQTRYCIDERSSDTHTAHQLGLARSLRQNARDQWPPDATAVRYYANAITARDLNQDEVMTFKCGMVLLPSSSWRTGFSLAVRFAMQASPRDRDD
jgi:hypothetical protein